MRSRAFALYSSALGGLAELLADLGLTVTIAGVMRSPHWRAAALACASPVAAGEGGAPG